MPNRENNVSRAYDTWKHLGKLGNIVSTTKLFLNLLGNVIASCIAFWEANLVSVTIFLEMAKQGNSDRKQCCRNNVT